MDQVQDCQICMMMAQTNVHQDMKFKACKKVCSKLNGFLINYYYYYYSGLDSPKH